MNVLIRTLMLIVLVGITTLISCAPSQPSDEKRALLHHQLGTALLEKGNYPGALRELLTAEELAPDSSNIQNNLGLAYFVRGSFEDSEKHLRKAIQLDSKFTEAKNNLGRVLIELNKLDESILILNDASKDLTYPNPEKPYTNLGIAYFFKKDFEKSKEYLKKSLKIKRNDCYTYIYYGRSLFELSQFQLAAETFDQAVLLCKTLKTDEPHYFGALSYLKSGDTSRAVARLEELIQYYPEGKYVEKSRLLLKTLR